VPRRLPILSESLDLFLEDGHRVKDPRPTYDQALYDSPNDLYKTRNCSNCLMWVKPAQQCEIFAPSVKITADHICGYWVGGKPHDKRMKHPAIKYVTADHAGLAVVPGGTSCKSCIFRKPRKGQKYDLCAALREGADDAEVETDGCCNLWTGKSTT